jgi:AraC family transcriptional regulator of adaptative response/methylated-DNA-[protein]-cysteine methyltransferase
MRSADYQRVEEAIEFIDENFRRQPSLSEVASVVGLSDYHFQRMFRRWAGVSPKRFLQYLTVDNAKERLRAGSSVLDATYDSGLSSAGRLHDLFVTTVAVTPGKYKHRGRGLTISYGFHDTPFGRCLIAMSDKGITTLEFVDDESDVALDRLVNTWRAARLLEDSQATAGTISKVFDTESGEPPSVALHIHGSNFQLKVWEALLKIPCGDIVSYHDVATEIGRPRSDRAVATAIARNPVAFLIPCHRVIRRSGAFGGYRWGPQRKRALLAWEAARAG